MAPGLSQNQAYFYCCPSEHPGPRLCDSQHLASEKLSKGRFERHPACGTQQRMFSRPQPRPGNRDLTTATKKIKCMHSGEEKGKSRRRKKWFRASDPTQEM